jgi:TatD DNase family protein
MADKCIFFDTHAHLDGVAPDAELDAVLARASAAGVESVLAVGGDPGRNRAACGYAQRWPRQVTAAVGYDRDCATREDADAELENLLATAPGIVALGEIGLDFHYHPETKAAQLRLQDRMLAMARRQRLPVIVHSRDAENETQAALDAHSRQWTGEAGGVGVIHCFTGSWSMARACLDAGYLISFSGIVTFRNADALREVARRAPLDRLLIETDSPYLAPVPHRGRTNEPALVRDVAACLAEVRGEPLSVLAAATTGNARRLFGGSRDRHA